MTAVKLSPSPKNGRVIIVNGGVGGAEKPVNVAFKYMSWAVRVSYSWNGAALPLQRGLFEGS